MDDDVFAAAPYGTNPTNLTWPQVWERFTVRWLARNLLDEALGHIKRDEWDDAEALLTERFADESVCATAKPAYEVESTLSDGRHYAACHLRRDEAVASAVDESALDGSAHLGAPGADD